MECTSKSLRVVYGDFTLGVHGEGFDYIFSYAQGGLESLLKNGYEWLYRCPKPTFWRALTDNDRGSKFHIKSGSWLAADMFIDCKDVEVITDGVSQGKPVAPENNKYGADVFAEGEVVNVTGTTKGKGFQGVIKRHNQSRGPMGHGSHYHRKPGSMGTMRPMRVFKGKKLPGHMGTLTVTIQNLEVVAVDVENGLILVKGNVPGAKKSLVTIRTSVKNPGKVNEREELVSYETATLETPVETETAETVESSEN